MKKFFKVICCTLLITLSIGSSFVFASNNESLDLWEGFLVIDTDKKDPLPARFRIIPSLNISGSAQFLPSQLENIKSTINKPKIFIVDLRQESHGFLNDIAVSYYSPLRLLNNGFSSEDTIANELEKFGNMEDGTTENIYNNQGRLLKTITVTKSQIEQELVENSDLDYVLFATRDGHIPTPEMVDSFVNFIKSTPESTHLHFHCKEGQGRTTMFMSMYQMMKENSSKSLEVILKEQLDAGGIVLTNSLSRANFLRDFYDYTKANSKTNFEVPFSTWAKENSNSQT